MTSHHHSLTGPWFAALALLATVACNQSPMHDLGYINNDLTGRRDERGGPRPPVAEFGAEFAGVWIGEAEDPLAWRRGADDSPPLYRFPSGSTRIRLDLSLGSELAYPNGTITFGDATPPPPATDPNVGYPLDPRFDINSSAARDASMRPPVEGFPYFISPFIPERDLGTAGVSLFEQSAFFEEGRIVDGKLDYSFIPTEVFASWCELQTSETCSADGIRWDEETGECFTGEEATAVDCQKASLCASNVCDCSGDTCTYSVELLASLTIRFAEDGVVGLFSDATFVNERGFQQPLGTVRFRRQAP